MTCGSFGVFTKMAVAPSTGDPSTTTFGASSERYEILAENVQAVRSLVGTQGLTGNLDPIANHLREGVTYVQGSILLEMGPFELSNWLPRILRKDVEVDGITYNMGDDANEFDILIKRDYGTALYKNCQVSRCLLRAASSLRGSEQVLQALITVVGKTEDNTASWPGSEPELPTLAEPFWVIGDTTMTLSGTSYPIDAFNLEIDNNLQLIPRNSLSIQCIRSAGRNTRLQFPTPLTTAAYSALYQSRFDGGGVLKFDAAKNLSPDAYYSTFTFPRLVQTRRTPATRGRTEIPLSIDLTAYRTDTDAPLAVTNELPDTSS